MNSKCIITVSCAIGNYFGKQMSSRENKAEIFLMRFARLHLWRFNVKCNDFEKSMGNTNYFCSIKQQCGRR